MNVFAALLRPVNSDWIRRYWLTILLAVAYVFSTWLSVEQDRIIAAQKSLIQTLYFDSASLVAMKAKMAREAKK
jgi:hypothetical protein